MPGVRSRLIVGACVLGGVTAACVPDPTTPPASTTTTSPSTTTTSTTSTTSTTTTAPPSVPGPDNRSVAVVGGLPVAASRPAMTPDGRYVAFMSWEQGLVSGFTPTINTVYRRDMVTGAIVAVSVGMSGEPSNESGTLPAGPESVGISDDGRYVMFTSQATNLAPGSVPANRYQVYVRDMDTGVTTRVSQAPGVPPDGEGRYPSISGNGQYVVFRSSSRNLGPVDPDTESDVYRWSRATGTLVRVSIGLDASSNEIEAAGASGPGIALNDGRVAFASTATNLLPGVTSPANGAYLADPATRAIQRIGSQSVQDASPDGRFIVVDNARILDLVANTSDPLLTDASGTAVKGSLAAISADGRFVITRAGSGILPGDTSTLGGTYLRDRQAGTKYRISRKYDGSPSPSYNNIQNLNLTDDGRYAAFDTSGGNNYLVGASSGGTWALVTRTPLP